MSKQGELHKDLLGELCEVDYVLSAWVIDAHGRVIAGHTEEELWNPADVGAAIMTCTGAAEMFGKGLLLGELRQSISEFQGGISMLAPLGFEQVLAVVAEPEVNLGMLRISFASILEQLREANDRGQETALRKEVLV